MIPVLLLAALLGPQDTTRVIDTFDDPAPWSAHPADGVQLALRGDRGRQGGAMRLDFSFGRGGGYAIARRAVNLDLPANYAFTVWIRGAAPINTLEFKLIDASGENVWWYTERDRSFTAGWQKLTIRRRQVSFAWGPQGGGSISHVAAIELVITAGQGGGGGSVWFDDLALTPLPEVVPPSGPPRVVASASGAGHGPETILDDDSLTSWRAVGPEAALTLDFGRTRELGGLTLGWEPGRAPRRYKLLASENGQQWRLLSSRTRGVGYRDALYLPDTETRFLRLAMHAPEGARGFGLATARIEPISLAATRNAFFEGIANDAPAGHYPRYLRGERGYWTVVGVDGAMEEALIDEDGAVEAGSGAFRVEPFLTVDGRLITWRDVRRTSSLLEGRLPIPSVEWRTGAVRLRTTAFPVGTARRSSVVVRYRLHNDGPSRLKATLHLATRAFQVNPSWQFLGTPGGVSRIDSMRWTGARLVVNGRRSVVPLTRPARVGLTTFAAGDIVEYLDRGQLPVASAVRDPFAAAGAAFEWPLDLAPGDSATIAVELPLEAGGRGQLAVGRAAAVDSAFGATAAAWRQAVDRASIALPAAGDHLSRTIASTLAYVLINRDGPAIQPGSRSYERSWIRDGA
ncbi:MAG: discoidin domain-containing protein, partial [Gemmatimonadales bacterium]|nr:discoidin domain-containing protein [Gemmatimonadales bacterium]